MKKEDDKIDSGFLNGFNNTLFKKILWCAAILVAGIIGFLFS